MANEPILTLVGNLTADPEVRFTQSGAAVAAFTIAQTPRVFDRQANEWRDGDALFMRVEAWRDLGENIGESLRKGDRVVVTGRLQTNNYTDRDGNPRYGTKVTADEVAPSLRYATAVPQKVQRGGNRPPAAAQQGTPAGQDDQWSGGDHGGHTDPPF